MHKLMTVAQLPCMDVTCPGISQKGTVRKIKPHRFSPMNAVVLGQFDDAYTDSAALTAPFDAP